MIVTAVTARAHLEEGKDGAKIATSKPKGALAKRIGDSKKLVAFEDNSLGEAWARAIAQRSQSGILQAPPLTPTDLISTISLDSDDHLRQPCPSHHTDLCWGDEGETFTSDAKAVLACEKDLVKLATKGFEVLDVRVAIVCTRRLNDAVGRGLSRFDVDLHTMERLTLSIREKYQEDVYSFCGKVGGFDFYGDRFGPLNGRLHTMLVEGRARSEYQFPGVGRLAFLRDADESHLIVGLASLVGKWARDHLMKRVVRWHRTRAPDGHDVPEASGYHDPNTSRFVAATSLIRKKQKLDETCFERTSIAKKEAAEAAAQEAADAAAAAAAASVRTKSGVRRKPTEAKAALKKAPARQGGLFD
jgi:hypothetical protein